MIQRRKQLLGMLIVSGDLQMVHVNGDKLEIFYIVESFNFLESISFLFYIGFLKTVQYVFPLVVLMFLSIWVT